MIRSWNDLITNEKELMSYMTEKEHMSYMRFPEGSIGTAVGSWHRNLSELMLEYNDAVRRSQDVVSPENVAIGFDDVIPVSISKATE